MAVGDVYPLDPIIVDFEYIPDSNGGLEVLCVVAHDLRRGVTYRRWRDELGAMPPYPHGPDTMMVAHNAQAEIEAYLSLGWPVPENIFDTMAEHLLDINGAWVPEMEHQGSASLLEALRANRLSARTAAAKKEWITRILAGPPYGAEERKGILDYCETDVIDTAALLIAIWPRLSSIHPRYIDQALLRGDYSHAMAVMKRVGMPVNAELHDRIIRGWSDIRAGLLKSIEHYGVYEGDRFNHARFATIVEALGAADIWPTTAGGMFSLKDKDFRRMAQAFPILEPFRVGFEALQGAHDHKPFPICPDGRLRLGMPEVGYQRMGLKVPPGLSSVGWGAYRSKTSRNQPRATEFLPAAASWWRTIVTPQPGKVIGAFDYMSEEYGIAACLSGDAAMIADYQQREVYIPSGIRAGLLPPDATKKSHKEFRDRVLKPLILGLQYGRQAEGIAVAIGGGDPTRYADDFDTATRIIAKHRDTHATFWDWTDRVIRTAQLTGRITTPVGWSMLVGDPAYFARDSGRMIQFGTKPLTLGNFLMQATGGDIMRAATAAVTKAGVRLFAPVHDALMFECDESEEDDVGQLVEHLMEEAARSVLGGFTIFVERSWVHAGENWRGARGDQMWGVVKKALGNAPELRGIA